MTETTSWTRSTVEQAIRDAAGSDADLRARLIAAPAEALTEMFGTAPRADLSFRVVEEQPGEVVLVLPAANDELSAAELDQASGGASYTIRFGNTTPPGLWVFQRPANPGGGSSIAWNSLPGGPGTTPPFSWWM